MSSSIPLVVDLDGTLLRSDLLLETGLQFIVHRPYRVDLLARWLMQGKPALKHNLAQNTEIDIEHLPYNQTVLNYIKQAKQENRKIVLATASHRLLADKIAAHLNVFDEVLATENNTNLSGSLKAQALVERYGEKGFDYIGNSKDDLPVWQVAHKAYTVNASSSLKRQAQNKGYELEILSDEKTVSIIKTANKAFRMHQWLKNILIFLPLLASHGFFNSSQLWYGILGFIAFGLCASSVYILNDLLDLKNDRCHHSKCKRPFASGRLSIMWGLSVFPILLLLSFLISYLWLPERFLIVLCAYYVLTLSYSLYIKRYIAFDVICLALLYTMRVVAGAALFSIQLSFWLLAFSVFLFLSLALVKRYTELFKKSSHQNKKLSGRGYNTDDLPIISQLGTAAGYITVLILALYINDAQTALLYQQPKYIWLACPLLLTWISYVWILAHRGQINDDPVIFAVTNRISLAIGVLIALVFWVAI